jgi:glucose/arabinose dehydrogenase
MLQNRWIRPLAVLAVPLTAAALLTSCDDDNDLPTEPGPPTGQGDVLVPEGFRIETVATGLTYATDVAFGADGATYIAEAGGHTYGTEPSNAPPARILRLTAGGGTEVVYDNNVPLDVIRSTQCDQFPEGLIGPITGITFNPDNGLLYIAHRTRVSTLDPQTGAFQTIVDCLPAWGPFQNNKVIFGPDDKMYFFVSTQSNSAVVGGHMLKVLTSYNKPHKHDIPCEDVTLTGQNFEFPNPFTPEPHDTAVTGTFVPFGVPVEEGQVIPGDFPCSGSIMRVRPDGTGLELVAWGFRNPYGYDFSPGGELFITENQYDVRGSRPVFGTGDLLWRVEPGTWYGWPDFYAGRPLTDDDWFQAPNKSDPDFVLLEHPQEPPRPVALLGVHSSSNGMDFSTSPEFGYVGQAFIAQFGDMAPKVGKVLDPIGFKIVRVNIEEGTIHDFAINRASTNGPASLLESGGLERPLDVQFSPDGTALYIADFGVMLVHEDTGIRPIPGTGVL